MLRQRGVALCDVVWALPVDELEPVQPPPGHAGYFPRPLPATLGVATDLLERSALARDWLGDDVVEHCVAMRRAELAAQSATVTDWEPTRYLEAL